MSATSVASGVSSFVSGVLIRVINANEATPVSLPNKYGPQLSHFIHRTLNQETFKLKFRFFSCEKRRPKEGARITVLAPRLSDADNVG